MEEGLIATTEITVMVINAIALLIIVGATLSAFAATLRAAVLRLPGRDARAILLHYAQWLVAALTFQLGADIIESSITTTWDAVGRLAAVAVIRTFLNYFLERDVAELRERQEDSPAPLERSSRSAP